MIDLHLDEAEGILIRTLIDLGLKQTGLQNARPLLALDDKIVAAGKVYEASFTQKEPA